MALEKHYYTWKSIKSPYKNNKFKISAPTWNDKFDLPDGSYYVSNIQDHFKYIIKKHETIANDPPMGVYTKKIKKRIVFNIKRGYTKKDVDRDTDGEVVPKLEFVEVILVNYNLGNNNYQQASKVLFTVSNKHCRQLITIAPH